MNIYKGLKSLFWLCFRTVQQMRKNSQNCSAFVYVLVLAASWEVELRGVCGINNSSTPRVYDIPSLIVCAVGHGVIVMMGVPSLPTTFTRLSMIAEICWIVSGRSGVNRTLDSETASTPTPYK